MREEAAVCKYRVSLHSPSGILGMIGLIFQVERACENSFRECIRAAAPLILLGSPLDVLRRFGESLLGHRRYELHIRL